ncbi:MAG: VanZ family protein [Intrasporangium sp.]|uniref:VanZ family protein n=1 Tax=Intrasporangium sp. TaxID=1925024 RepID=UPI002649D82F|nr:VanZ family protein [Intrasporangium sp.]MDN5795212.1 VanZ family protein [Intrasporangium sp.]
MLRLRVYLSVAVAAGLVVLHLCVLYWPVVTVQGPVSWSDKVVHVLVFALPAFAVGWVWRRIWLTAMIFGAHAVVSELVQALLLPGRSGDPWDTAADLIGVGVAVVALLVVRRRAQHW